MSTQQKGNIAETAIQLELERLLNVGSVISIPNQKDSNHSDLIVSLAKDHLFFIAQVKYFSKANLTLKMSHLQDWLASKVLTVPIWWDENARKAYWADIVSYLVRTGGVRERRWATFDLQLDLHTLDPGNPASAREFTDWIEKLASLWPRLVEDDSGTWIKDPEFPVSFARTIMNPDILLYLPVNSKLIHTLRNSAPHGINGSLIHDVFRAGSKAISLSPEVAVQELLQKHKISFLDKATVDGMVTSLSHWARRIGTNRKSIVANTFSAFRQTLSIMSYQKSGDLKAQPFRSTHTYPVRHLLNLLPVEFCGKQLELILSNDHRVNVLLNAANYFGVLNWPSHADISKRAKELRYIIRRRSAQIGLGWRAVDRQLLYTEAQLGSEEAKAQFLRASINHEGHRFDSAHIFRYHGNRSENVLKQFENRFDERPKSDDLVTDLLQVMYAQVREKLRNNPTSLKRPFPDLWPVDGLS